MPLPPWLDITPQSYMQAVEAGDRAGMAIAQERNRVDENAFKQWLQQQQLRQEAQQTMAKLQQAQSAQQALQAYRMREAAVREAQSKVGALQAMTAAQRATEYQRHNQIAEQELANYHKQQLDRDTSKVHFGVRGEVLKYNPDGSVTELRPGTPVPKKLSSEDAILDYDMKQELDNINKQLVNPLSPDSRYDLQNRKLYLIKKRIALAEKSIPTATTNAITPPIKEPGMPAIDPITTTATNAPAIPKLPSSTTNEIIRMTKSGRKAVFDATTKQFLRYADEGQLPPESNFHF